MTPAKQRFLILGLVVVGLLAVSFFGLRALHAFRRFNSKPPPFPPATYGDDKAETDVELIREWMTIPFIARTYQVPPPVLFEALDISPRGNDEKSLEQLNEEFFPDAPGLVLNLIKAAVRAHQALLSVPAPLTAVPPKTAVPPQTPVPASP